jgi:uncharacterized protein (DUF3820 family)
VPDEPQRFDTLDGYSSPILNPENFKKLATTQMPFGKYKGRLLIDLPEAYLLWFVKKEAFPKGSLGDLMQLSLELHIHGLVGLIQPLIKGARSALVDVDT